MGLWIRRLQVRILPAQPVFTRGMCLSTPIPAVQSVHISQKSHKRLLDVSGARDSVTLILRSLPTYFPIERRPPPLLNTINIFHYRDG